MWPGRFRIHAVVTTDLNGGFYDWYGRARNAALDIAQQLNPGTNSIPGWPISILCSSLNVAPALMSRSDTSVSQNASTRRSSLDTGSCAATPLDSSG